MRSEGAGEMAAAYNPEELAQLLRGYEMQFLADSNDALPAFQAVMSIVGFYWHSETCPADGSVRIPWWAAQVIAGGFNIYWDAELARARISMGQAFGLEPDSKGGRPRIAQMEREIRNRRVALAVAKLVLSGSKVHLAIDRASEQFALSQDSIRKIWRRLGKRAKELTASG